MYEGKKVICCIGDSLTEGDYGISGKRGIPNVHPQNYPYFLEKMAGCIVRNFGKCGWRASHMLQWYREGGFHVADADFIIILLGTNGKHSMAEDVPDNEAYFALLKLLSEEAPAAQIFLCTPPHVTTNPAMSNCGYGAQVAESVCFVRSVAEKTGLPLIDLAKDSRFTDETEPVLQPNDGLHFAEEGYRALAEAVYQGIGACMEKGRA